MVTRASGMRTLISRSISPASIAMVGHSPALNLRQLAGHVGRQPAFEMLAQNLDQDGALAAKRQCIAAGCPNCPHRDARSLSALKHRLNLSRRHSEQVARLVLAEPVGMRRDIVGRGRKL